MTYFLSGIEEDERAMVKIASALTRIAIVMEKRYEKEYPTKTPRDATITKLKSEEDELRESQGATGESLDDWLTDPVGPREREVLKKKQ